MTSRASQREQRYREARGRLLADFRRGFNRLAHDLTRRERLLAAHLVSGSPPDPAIAPYLAPEPGRKKPNPTRK